MIDKLKLVRYNLTKQIIELHNGELLVNSKMVKSGELTMKLLEKQP